MKSDDSGRSYGMLSQFGRRQNIAGIIQLATAMRTSVPTAICIALRLLAMLEIRRGCIAWQCPPLFTLCRLTRTKPSPRSRVLLARKRRGLASAMTLIILPYVPKAGSRQQQRLARSPLLVEHQKLLQGCPALLREASLVTTRLRRHSRDRYRHRSACYDQHRRCVFSPGLAGFHLEEHVRAARRVYHLSMSGG